MYMTVSLIESLERPYGFLIKHGEHLNFRCSVSYTLHSNMIHILVVYVYDTGIGISIFSRLGVCWTLFCNQRHILTRSFFFLVEHQLLALCCDSMLQQNTKRAHTQTRSISGTIKRKYKYIKGSLRVANTYYTQHTIHSGI